MRIPKVLHQIWLGPKPLPDEFKHYSQQWAQCHPDWEMKLWTSNNLPKMTLQDEFNETPTWSGKSDILRMELIHQFGGVYVDTDFECFLNIEPLISACECFATLDPQADGSSKAGTAMFGAVPNHSVISDIVKQTPDAMHDYAARGPAHQVGPGIAALILLESDLVLKVPTKYTHPYGSWERKREKETFPEAYAVHRWAKSWGTPQKAVSFIVACHNNRRQIESSIESVIHHADSDYVLVDWNSDDGTADWVEKNYPQARVLRINSKREFNLSYAMNIGSGLSGGAWQCFLHPSTVLRSDILPRLLGSPKQHIGGASGAFFMCSRSLFYSVGGYDDLLEGGEVELRTRMSTLGFESGTLPVSLIFNPEQAALDSSCALPVSPLRKLYSVIKRDLILLSSDVIISRAFRSALYGEIRAMCQRLEETKQEQALEVDMKNLSIRTGFQGKDSVQLCRTMKYVLKY